MARPSVEINSGSMADISFLLLTFFLLTSSIDTDLGILRKLPPPLPPDVEAPDVNKRNVLNVLVNKYDQLMVSGKPTDINSLRQVAKDFLSNPTNSPDLSESKLLIYLI